MNKLTLHSIDNGNCRVYYQSGKGKDTRLFCYLESIGSHFALYVCSRDGEPSHSICHDSYVNETPLPVGDSATEVALRKWLVTIKRPTHNALEKMAYGQAAGKILSNIGKYEGKWIDGAYAAYLYLRDCVNKREDHVDLSVAKEYENLEWTDVLEDIETEADVLLISWKRVLELAKAGIVHATIECELDGDLNELDMIHMVELGDQHG